MCGGWVCQPRSGYRQGKPRTDPGWDACLMTDFHRTPVSHSLSTTLPALPTLFSCQISLTPSLPPTRRLGLGAIALSALYLLPAMLTMDPALPDTPETPPVPHTTPTIPTPSVYLLPSLVSCSLSMLFEIGYIPIASKSSSYVACLPRTYLALDFGLVTLYIWCSVC